MSKANGWGGQRAVDARTHVHRAMLATWAAGGQVTCPRCRQPITPTQRWHVGHAVDITTRPDLRWSPANWRPEHGVCNERASAHHTNAMRSTRRQWRWT